MGGGDEWSRIKFGQKGVLSEQSSRATEQSRPGEQECRSPGHLQAGQAGQASASQAPLAGGPLAVERDGSRAHYSSPAWSSMAQLS